jgi:pyruvate formate lyase activating enzyme
MKIAGLLKNSFVDYPGQIAAVIFTPGCNYDCFYCHNRSLIGSESPQIDEQMVFAFLEKRKNLIDAVVITGGEPTLQKGLEEFIIKVRKLGYKIKLDTNGSNPQAVKDLLHSDLLDYIALDYKAPFDRYNEICGDTSNGDNVKQTLDIIKKSGVDYELRTTFVPQLNLNDIEHMIKEVAPIKSYAIQHYRMPEEYREQDLFKLNKKPHSAETFKQAQKICKKYVINTIIR